MNRFNQILVAGILLLIPVRAMQATDTNSPAGHGTFKPGPEDPFLWLEDIHGAHASKAGPCVRSHGLEQFAVLRARMDGCLTGSQLAKDRAADALTKVMIPEALDYPA